MYNYVTQCEKWDSENRENQAELENFMYKNS